MILTAEDIEAVAVRVAELVKQPAAQREVLSAREAAQFVGKPGRDAFRDWRAKFQVRPCGHGRYSLRSLKAAMEREARKTYVHTGGGKAA
jgi:hypothetical protein